MPDLKDRLRDAKKQSKPDLKSRLQAVKDSEQAGETMKSGEAARVAFFDRSVNTGFNIPAGLSEIAAQGLAGVTAGMNAPVKAIRNQMEGQPANLFGEFADTRQDMLVTQPIKAMRNFPRPPENLGEQFRALASAGDPFREDDPQRPTFDERLELTRKQEAERTRQAKELFPGMFGAGEIASDVGAMVSGRTPLARSRAAGQAAQRAAIIEQARKGFDDLPHNIKGQFEDVFTEKIVPLFKESAQRLGRGTGKVAETGFEAALFAAINDGDLETAFGLGAGGQAIGSASLFLMEKPTVRLLPAVGIAFVASEMMKAVGPGDQDFFESKDFAIQKTVAALALGLVSGLAGAGRLRGPTAERLPALMDSITSIPRSVITSRMAELTKEGEAGNNAPMMVMQRFATNPSAFTEDQQNALMRAMNNPRQGVFTKEVNRLMGNEDFVRRLEPRDLNDPATRLRALTPTHPIQRN